MTARCVLFVSLAAALAPAPAGAACPTITRDKIISIAKSGVGCKYVWGGTCWNPKNKSWKGADCSGYVTVCWQIPKASATTSCLAHYYTTSSYKNSSTHWSSISRNSLIKADALVYNTGSKGHIVLYSSGNKWGNAMVYEAMGTAYGIRYRTRYVTSNYVARRRHRLGAVKPTYPLMTIKVSAATIGGQGRDFCTLYKSKGIFDWRVGQKTSFYVDVKNSGTAVAKNAYVGLWAEQPYLKVAKWNIYSNWKQSGKFVLNDTDGLQKIGRTNPKQTFKLWLGAISPGETKRVVLTAQALKFSVGAVDHPDVRAWVSHVDGFYEKKDFGSSFNNVKGYQKQSGGNLRSYAQTDVLSKEVCDKKDNDCDGQVDEGVCSSPKPQPKKDAGSPKPTPDSGAPAAPDSGAPDGWDPEPPTGGDAWVVGDLPGQSPGAGSSELSGGGCSVSATSRLGWPVLLMLLMLAVRRGRATR